MVRDGGVPEHRSWAGLDRRWGAGSLGTWYRGEEHTAFCLSWEMCPKAWASLGGKELGTHSGPSPDSKLKKSRRGFFEHLSRMGLSS